MPKRSHRSSSSLPQQQLHNIQQSFLEDGEMRMRSSSITIPSSLDFTSSISETEGLPEIIMEAPTPRRYARFLSALISFAIILLIRNSDSALSRFHIKKNFSIDESSISVESTHSSLYDQQTNENNTSFRYSIHAYDLCKGHYLIWDLYLFILQVWPDNSYGRGTWCHIWWCTCM